MNTTSLPSCSPPEHSLPEVDRERCTGCGWCAQVCPCQAVALDAHGPVFDPSRCGCAANCPPHCPSAGLCEEVCPTQAISCSFDITNPDS